jgi:hypothetical protein
MPVAHTADYYKNAVMEAHDVASVRFETEGLGRIAVTVLPAYLQQPVIDWLNGWAGRAVYIHFHPPSESVYAPQPPVP